MTTEKIRIDGQLVTVSKVVKIKPTELRHVYDIEVKGVHNYYAGGVNVHNCEYHQLLEFYGDKYDDEFMKFGQELIHYRHRDLVLSPSGPSKRTLRGDTRIAGALDEIGWFPNEEGSDDRERQSADEVYIALDRSLKTVRAAAEDLLKEGYDNIVTGLLCCISSPAHHRDKIMQLVRANESSTDELTIHLPTWEFNPNMPRSKFKKDFRDNPVKAERDFGANPPLNERPFFSNTDAILKVFGPLKNKVNYQYKIYQHERTGQRFKYAEFTSIHAGTVMYPSIMCLDAGSSNNSFSVSVGHVETLHGTTVFKVDACIEVAPNYKKNTIHYTRLHTYILEKLVSKFNVRCVVSDRWQNKKIMSDLMEKFPYIINTEYRLTYEDMSNVRDYIQDDEERTVYLPQMEISEADIDKLDTISNYPHCFKYKPLAHLFFQMQTIQDAGNQVVKGQNLTDDNWRSVVMLLAFLMDEDYVAENLTMGAAAQTSGVATFAGRNMSAMHTMMYGNKQGAGGLAFQPRGQNPASTPSRVAISRSRNK